LRRLLLNLADRGYVRQDPLTRLYRLGLRCWQLGVVAVGGLGLQALLQPLLLALARQTLEQVTVWVYEDGDAICVQRAEGSQRVRSSTQIGAREPAHLLASGKCLLAGLPADRLAADLARFALPSARLEELRAELALARQRGYAVSEGDRWAGVSAVAAPVLDHTGTAVASMSVSGPSGRFPADVVLTVAAAVTAATIHASAELGFQGGPAGAVRCPGPVDGPGR
jgi:DNA-binding IclR family transcriptional regulator